MPHIVPTDSKELQEGEQFVFLDRGKPTSQVWVAVKIVEKLSCKMKGGELHFKLFWTRHEIVGKIIG